MKKNVKDNKVVVSWDEYVTMKAMASNMVHISNKNQKTGICVNCLSFPVTTCRPDAPCYKQCYVNKGRQKMANVQASYYRNLILYTKDKSDFWEQVTFYVKHNPLPYFRFFESGDFPDADFIGDACKLAEKFPNVKFMAFTKKYDLVNEYVKNGGNIPENFNIVFSMWDKSWNEGIKNPYGFTAAFVNFGDNSENIPSNAFKCGTISKTCSGCGACFNKGLKAVEFKKH